VENVNADTGNRLRFTEFGRALQLRIRNRADDNEVLGERKRKGLGNATRHVDSLRRLRCPEGRVKKRDPRERDSKPSTRLSDPCAPSRPIRKKWASGLRTGRGHMVRLLALAGASSRRGETRRWLHHPGREDGPLVDASVRCMQLQKLFGRAQGSRCRPALSVGRRRDLAFGSFGPPSHRKGRREKRNERLSRAKTCGVTDRKRAPQGHSKRDRDGWLWVVVLAGTRSAARS